MGSNEDPLQLEYTRVQIEACERASKVVGDPPPYEFRSVLDQFDDDLPSCNNPVISGDGNILIFLVDYPSDKKIMMTERTGSVWSRPRVINSEIGMVGETYPVCLSYDGKDLYLVHQYYSHSDIFVSRFEAGRWSQAEALGANINGRTSETHASISKDVNTLFFTSDRRGGQGSSDIYVSRRQPGGKWGPGTNLGPVINTKFEEHTPFISSNDSILFFSSQGHSTIGGLDIFYSELAGDGSWGEPVNLGYSVNTTGDNLFFNPGWDELDGYYAVRREDDPTSNTIKMVIKLEPPGDTEASLPGEENPEWSPDPARITEVMEPRETDRIEEVIEPRETDLIEEVLNRADSEDEKSPVEPDHVKGPSVIHTNIPFDHNKYELNLAATLEVEKIADLMLEYPDLTAELTGHADATGAADYNMLLSMQRADYIAQYLVARGVKEERITVRGVGENSPMALDSFPDGKDAPLGRYLNRHVNVTLKGSLPSDAGLPAPYVPANLRPSGEQSPHPVTPVRFTIQVMAGLHPVDNSQFMNLGHVEEFICRDGYYRYAFGDFNTFNEAKRQLPEVRRKGYYGAFIQTREWYSEATR
jgi:outer membrane protein OmpA-like peptidoglycan-associated protein